MLLVVKWMNKGIMVLLTTLVLLGIYLLYTTFAINSYVDNSNTDSYTITLTEDNNTITVPANSDKMIFYQIKNNNDGNVRYGVGYTSNGVDVKVYDDSIDSHMGVLEYGENKFVKLRLSNTTDSDSSVTLSAVLGYEYGGDLIVPNGITLVSEVYTLPVVSSPIPIAEYISNLYTNADKSTFTNNSITYNTASSLLLMNDRLGGTSSSLDGGNIRYYGASPNNYIYFNCEEYPDTNCELWRIIGVFDGKVKIIRNGVIGAYSWDTSSSGVNTGYGVNEWSKADLMKLLNPNYETSSVGGSLYYSEVKTGKCYNNKTNGKVDCDFTSVGIKNNDTINKIADVTYNNGGWNSSSVYSDVMYEKERGTKVKSNASDGVSIKVTGNGSATSDKLTLTLSDNQTEFDKGTYKEIDRGVKVTYNGKDVTDKAIITYSLNGTLKLTISSLEDAINELDSGEEAKITYSVKYSVQPTKTIEKTIKIK